MIQTRLRHLLGLETFLNETPLLQSRSSSQGCYSHWSGNISKAVAVSSIHEWFDSRQEKTSFFAKVCSQVSAFSQNSKPAFTTPTSYQDLTIRRRSWGSDGGRRESKPQKNPSAQSRTAAWSFPGSWNHAEHGLYQDQDIIGVLEDRGALGRDWKGFRSKSQPGKHQHCCKLEAL